MPIKCLKYNISEMGYCKTSSSRIAFPTQFRRLKFAGETIEFHAFENIGKLMFRIILELCQYLSRHIAFSAGKIKFQRSFKFKTSETSSKDFKQ
jgi:hypothetical protein